MFPLMLPHAINILLLQKVVESNSIKFTFIYIAPNHNKFNLKTLQRYNPVPANSILIITNVMLK